MVSKLETVEIPSELKAGLRLFARLEGQRSAEQLIENAVLAYLKVLRGAIKKDSEIQAKVAKKLSPSGKESGEEEPKPAAPEGETQTGPVRIGKKLTAIAS